MKTRRRLLIALALFVVAGAMLLIVIFMAPPPSNANTLPYPSETVSGNQPAAAAVLANNAIFKGQVSSGARYFSCETGGVSTGKGVVLYSYDGNLWAANGSFISTYEVFANASNDKIVQFSTYPFVSTEPAPLPQMQNYPTYKFSVGLVYTAIISPLDDILTWVAIIMIGVAVILFTDH